MSRISILGCGWLGLPLADKLISHGYHVNGSTTTTNKLKKIERLGVKPYFIDLSPDFKGDISFFNCDILIINIPPRNIEGDSEYHEKQLLSIKNQIISKRVGKVIFVSSTAVYPNNNQVVTEKDAGADNLSRGGVSLLNMEQIFTQENSFETTVVRFGGLYGPGRHPGKFLAGKHDLRGANNPVNMIHLEDCLNILLRIVADNIWNETFNAVSPNKLSREEFYKNAAQELKIEAPQFSKDSQPYKDASSQHLIDVMHYQFIH